MTYILQYYFLISSLSLIKVDSNYQCTNSHSSPKYHLIEKCYQSTLGITAKAKYTTLSSCQKLGIEKRGLAINFSPPEARKYGDDQVYTCEILKCAEVDGASSLVNDTRYDYYSLYAKPIAHVNATCVPAIGMFYLMSHLNYTQAVKKCRNLTGVLADVTSEQRTDALAQVLSGASVEAAYVGLRSNNGSSFVTVTGDTLDCTTYRAWAPGHPRRHRKNFDCVLLTRHRTWQTIPCKKAFPTLCELLPGGPYKHGSIFATRNQNVSIQKPEEDKY